MTGQYRTGHDRRMTCEDNYYKYKNILIIVKDPIFGILKNTYLLKLFTLYWRVVYNVI